MKPKHDLYRLTDPDGLMEQLTGCRPVGGMGAAGFASQVEGFVWTQGSLV